MTQVRYYQTDDMEGAARSLAERHHNVLVLMDYKSVKPIRMRTAAKLSDLEMEWVMAWKPGADAVIERWRRKGGILLYRSEPWKFHPTCPVADAILFCEAPMQWDRFEHACMSARQEVVVYRPPMWELHGATIEHLYPRRDTYEMLEAYLDALMFTEQSEFRSKVAALSGFKQAVAFTANDLMRLANWDEKYLRFVLRRYRFAVHRWHIYSTRFIPENADMRWAYQVLKAQPEVDTRQHALRFGDTRPRTLGFKGMLKRLVKEKYVVAEDCVYVADTQRKRADIDEFDAVNNMHRGKWFKLRNFIDELQEYQI